MSVYKGVTTIRKMLESKLVLLNRKVLLWLGHAPSDLKAIASHIFCEYWRIRCLLSLYSKTVELFNLCSSPLLQGLPWRRKCHHLEDGWVVTFFPSDTSACDRCLFCFWLKKVVQLLQHRCAANNPFCHSCMITEEFRGPWWLTKCWRTQTWGFRQTWSCKYSTVTCTNVIRYSYLEKTVLKYYQDESRANSVKSTFTLGTVLFLLPALLCLASAWA